MAISKSGRRFSNESNFRDVVCNGYYVDKSLLIKDLIDGHSVNRSMLFTRPRRFGKSLNLSMIRTFFEKTDVDTSIYFKDLDIWKCGDKYTSEQGKYPIISLDFKDVLDKSWDKMYSGIRSCIASEYSRFDFVESKLKRDKAKIFRDIKNRKADESDFANSLKFLCEALFTYYGVKPIILIDEYDVPIQKGYEKGYYAEVVDFIRSLFSAVFKGTDLNITFAVIIGSLQIAKESIFTGLNNLGVYSVMTKEYSQYFGFTREEVKRILDEFGAPEKEKEILGWYGGYRFGNTEIFNPWSVSRYVDENFTFDTYWNGSSEHAILKRLIEKATRGDAKALRGLFADVPITDDIAEDVSFEDLFRTKKGRTSAIYSVMLATGFLAPQHDKTGPLKFVIPNGEIKEIYSQVILKRL